MTEKKRTGLELLREPFPANQISKLPKPTKAQTDAVKADFKKGIRCQICGAWHHPDVIHLDYVGHAALTDRLLDADPNWTWEPLALDEKGYPVIDGNGGMWIKLTVCGVTRLGYGDAQGKTGGDAMKERIGDCLISGTLITTNRGNIPIENVKTGDLVPTRIGWKKVTDHWLSSKSAPVKKVVFTNGAQIIGTPHHKVPTSNGVKRIEELRNSDIMYSFENEQSRWLTKERVLPAKTPNLMGAFIGESLDTGLCIENGILWQPLNQETTSIEIFTNSIMERYLKGFMFIIPMVILTITTIKIWLQSILQSILRCTHILNSDSLILATNAEGVTLRYLNAQNGAVRPARRREDGKMGWLMSSLKTLRKLKHLYAQNVESNLNQLSHGLNFATVSVVEVVDAGLGEVWNLSVEDQHEYVANGILVNNCLRNAAMRFGAALDLWHKGDLHVDEQPPEPEIDDIKFDQYITIIKKAQDMAALKKTWIGIPKHYRDRLEDVKDNQKRVIEAMGKTND